MILQVQGKNESRETFRSTGSKLTECLLVSLPLFAVRELVDFPSHLFDVGFDQFIEIGVGVICSDSKFGTEREFVRLVEFVDGCKSTSKHSVSIRKEKSR